VEKKINNIFLILIPYESYTLYNKKNTLKYHQEYSNNNDTEFILEKTLEFHPITLQNKRNKYRI